MIEIENTYGYFMSGFRDIGDKVTWPLCPETWNKLLLKL